MPIDYEVVKLDKGTDSFYSAYRLQQTIECSPEFVINPDDTSSRICRFCRKREPEVTFNNKAHLIPFLIGNQHLLSNFECDCCNAYFSKYESDLARFLSVQRTFNRIRKRKGGVAGFNTYNKDVSVEHVESSDSIVLKVDKSNPQENAISHDESTDTLTITFQTQDYRPLRVYKALIKIALSVMSEDEMKHYEYALKYLTTEQYDKDEAMAFPVDWWTTCWDQPFENVKVSIFKKIDPQNLIPTHVMFLYVGWSVFVVPIPFYKPDMYLFHKRKIGFYFPAKVTDDSQANIFDGGHRDVFLTSSNELTSRTDRINIGNNGVLQSYLFATGEPTEEKMNVEKVWAVIFAPDATYIAQGH